MVSHFSAYRFKSQGITVTFDLRDVDIEKDNVKGDKRFFIPISTETNYNAETNEVCIPFEYRPLTDEEKSRYGTRDQQDKIIDVAESEIIASQSNYFNVLSALEHQTVGITILKEHLRAYTRRNTADFFIHKNLKQFLNSELDVYIKNEVLPLSALIFEDTNFQEDNLNLNKVNWIETAKLVNTIASQIIEFLSYIEEFQKRLWLKKKFVLSTDYCLTLDRVPEEFYPEIVQNTDQLNEWKDLFAIHEINSNLIGNDYTESLSVNFLTENQNLVLDTCHFDTNFKDRLLEYFDDLDDITDGLLIHGENFQGLNLLTEKYKESLKAIYIDPPYNTGADGFLYRDSFRHSSWMSLMYDRLLLSRKVAQQNSAIAISINEEELFNLKLLLDAAIGSTNYLTTITVKVRHDDRILKGFKEIHEVTEQLLVYRNSPNFTPTKRIVDNTSNDDYCWQVTEISKSQETLLLGNKNVAVFSPDDFFIKRVEPSEKNLKKINIRGSLRRGNSAGEFFTNYLESMFNDYRGYLFKVPNMGNDGLGYRYIYIPGPDENRKNADYFQGVPLDRADTKGNPYPNHWRAEEGFWDMEPAWNRVGYEGSVTFRSGKKPLEFVTKYLVLAGVKDDVYSICLDFFGGSGTTGHAIINLNRQDEGKRKYILIEMGHHFETALKPRIMKAVYAEDWNDDQPISRESPLSHMFKYQHIESYEDTLNNIQFNETERENLLLDEHQFSYLLGRETSKSPTFLNVDKLQNPFSYQLNIVKDMQTQTQTVDVPETFNYLLGISVKTRQCLKDGERCYLVYKGTVGQKTVVIIWRETEGWNEQDWEQDCRFIEEHKLARRSRQGLR